MLISAERIHLTADNVWIQRVSKYDNDLMRSQSGVISQTSDRQTWRRKERGRTGGLWVFPLYYEMNNHTNTQPRTFQNSDFILQLHLMNRSLLLWEIRIFCSVYELSVWRQKAMWSLKKNPNKTVWTQKSQYELKLYSANDLHVFRRSIWTINKNTTEKTNIINA